MNLSHRSMHAQAGSSHKGLYIHIPFCDGKCAYCAFYSIRYERTTADLFIDALECDMRRAAIDAGGFVPETVYIGGGTPTILENGQLRRLMALIKKYFPAKPVEWTVEANPGSLTDAKLRILRQGGANRISLGIQATDDAVLARLGRRHTWNDALQSVAAIRAAEFSNWNLDLIACVPGVTIDAWRDTLHRILDLNPPHVSVYALTVEEGSRLAQSRGFRSETDTRQLRVLHMTRNILAHAGVCQYEISNYAVAGRECLHNCGYWCDMDYIGCGPAAATRIRLHRRIKRPDVIAYISNLTAGKQAPGRNERLTPLTSATEALIFGLRMNQGVNIDSILDCHGLQHHPIADRWRATLRQLVHDSMVRHVGGWWRLTARGRDLADAIAVELMD